MTVIAHLTSSRFFGGPERQMLELAASLPAHYRSLFISFSEDGTCRDFLDRAGRDGHTAVELKHDMPYLPAAARELVKRLRDLRPDLLCCHGYKANLLGWLAARRLKIPAVSVSRGWTAENFRVRLYEALDRLVLRAMDKVVCVSAEQSKKLLRAGIPSRKTAVIHNAIRSERFARPQAEYRDRLRRLFPRPPKLIVGAAGRLSPEKGFEVLVDAADDVINIDPDVGFVLFGEGRMRGELESRIRQRGLERSFVLAGFHGDLDEYLPHFDLFVLPSFTEGLPNVVLEAMAAGVPVVATAVGGTPEVVEDGVSGCLVPPGDCTTLARQIGKSFLDDAARQAMGLRGRQRVKQHFSFASQASSYRRLFEGLIAPVASSARSRSVLPSAR